MLGCDRANTKSLFGYSSFCYYYYTREASVYDRFINYTGGCKMCRKTGFRVDYGHLVVDVTLFTITVLK